MGAFEEQCFRDGILCMQKHKRCSFTLVGRHCEQCRSKCLLYNVLYKPRIIHKEVIHGWRGLIHGGRGLMHGGRGLMHGGRGLMHGGRRLMEGGLWVEEAYT